SRLQALMPAATSTKPKQRDKVIVCMRRTLGTRTRSWVSQRGPRAAESRAPNCAECALNTAATCSADGADGDVQGTRVLARSTRAQPNVVRQAARSPPRATTNLHHEVST